MKVPSLVANGRFQAWWPKKGSKLSGQRKVISLLANGRFQARWPKGGSKLGGQWKVPSLVANGRFQVWWPKEGEGKTPFHLLPLSPQQIYLNFQFIVMTYEIRVFFEGAQKEVFSSIFKKTL